MSSVAIILPRSTATATARPSLLRMLLSARRVAEPQQLLFQGLHLAALLLQLLFKLSVAPQGIPRNRLLHTQHAINVLAADNRHAALKQIHRCTWETVMHIPEPAAILPLLPAVPANG
jgi:hypothetical protein